MVRELARVMKPDSDVFVSDLHSEAYARGWRTGFRDGPGSCQIETLPRTAEEIVSVFHSAGFECLTHLPLCFLANPNSRCLRRRAKVTGLQKECSYRQCWSAASDASANTSWKLRNYWAGTLCDAQGGS